MTGPERQTLAQVSSNVAQVTEMVRGIARTLGDDDTGLVKRVRTIEQYVAQQEGGDIADARNAERRTSESRWRKGVALSIALAIFGTVCSVALGLANLMLNTGAS